MAPVPWVQVVVLAGLGIAFGYCARRFYWRQRVASEVEGNDDVQAFERRTAERRISAAEKARRMGWFK